MTANDLGDNLSAQVNGVPRVQRATPSPRGKGDVKSPERVRILLEENDDIPPTGLFLGLNGQGYMLKPGRPALVPKGLVEILENSVTTVPVIDPETRRVVGYRDRQRFPFRLLAAA